MDHNIIAIKVAKNGHFNKNVQKFRDFARIKNRDCTPMSRNCVFLGPQSQWYRKNTMVQRNFPIPEVPPPKIRKIFGKSRKTPISGFSISSFGLIWDRKYQVYILFVIPRARAFDWYMTCNFACTCTCTCTFTCTCTCTCKFYCTKNFLF